MSATPVIAIFDTGKTNKKLFLFDEHYKIVWEQTASFSETTDEEGEPCEDLDKLTGWVQHSFQELLRLPDFDIRAINFSAYGASLVHIGAEGTPVAPLYSYLKPYPEELKKKFYDNYGGEVTFSMLTASPVLGSLNSGMQLYRIKEEQPELFGRIRYSLHLPQYLSFLLTGKRYSDITSIGCHTNLWNFSQDHYHEWVYREGITDKLAPVMPSTSVVPVSRGGTAQSVGNPTQTSSSARYATVNSGSRADLLVGIGLHDSSAAVIPYLESFHEPFVLISTGTWCISMNPFNKAPLTVAELQKDCLCYMSYQGRPVKASRLFAGYEHEQQVKRLGAHFHKAAAYAATLAFDPEIVSSLRSKDREQESPAADGLLRASVFSKRELNTYANYEQAYHRLLMDIMEQQVASTQLV